MKKRIYMCCGIAKFKYNLCKLGGSFSCALGML